MLPEGDGLFENGTDLPVMVVEEIDYSQSPRKNK
jgi:hypothetical protein